MDTLIVILLAIIAYILWRIYRQKEEEKEMIISEKLRAENKKIEVEYEAEDKKLEDEYRKEFKEQFKDYPHLIGNIDDSYLEIYSGRKELNLKQAWLNYAHEANNPESDSVEVDLLFHSLWNITEELLEHLEKYHEGTKDEHEIAINNYWRIIIEKADSFNGEKTIAIKKMFQSEPFTDIIKIISWFPKKANHPAKEIVFTDKNGIFPRESKGSIYIDEKLKALGL